jgi:hypothetical protein
MSLGFKYLNIKFVQQTKWSRSLIEKLIVAQLEKMFRLNGGQRLIITEWWIQCKRSNPVFLKSISMLSSHLLLSIWNCLFSSYFPTRIVYVNLVFVMRTTSTTCTEATLVLSDSLKTLRLRKLTQCSHLAWSTYMPKVASESWRLRKTDVIIIIN